MWAKLLALLGSIAIGAAVAQGVNPTNEIPYGLGAGHKGFGFIPPPASSPQCLQQNTTGAPFYALCPGGRLRLASPTNFFVDGTLGSNVASCGVASGSGACATRNYLFNNVILPNYDLNSQTITINIAAGTYTDGLSVNGALVGQLSPGNIIFTGPCTSGHTSDVLIQPTTAVNSYASAFGAGYRVQCQKVDHSKILTNGGGADMFSIGQGGTILFGNPSLLGVRADLTFGCNLNPYNTITDAFRGYGEVDNSFNIDTGLCRVNTTATTTLNSGTLTLVGTLTGVVVGMGVQGTGIPSDAYVAATVTSPNNQITLGCIFTSPCQATANGTPSIAIVGGGQDFLDLGNGAQFYFNTNGDPSFSLIGTFSNYYFATAGFFYVNDASALNAQAITWVLPGLAVGQCAIVTGISALDIGGLGSPYIPCHSNTAQNDTGGISVVQGTPSFTMTPQTGVQIGNAVSDIARQTCTWLSGQSIISCNFLTGIVNGMRIVNTPGILAGSSVLSTAGSATPFSVAVGGCGSGPQCVSGNPTYLSETNTQVFFVDGCLDGTSVVNSLSGTTIGLSGGLAAGNPGGIKSSCTVELFFNNSILLNSIIK